MNDRELDALVAEKVMGWKVTCGNALHTADWSRKRCCSPDLYSTDIAAAFLVAAKMGEWSMCFDAIGSYGVLFGNEIDEDRRGWTYAESLPLAICNAALEAVGYRA